MKFDFSDLNPPVWFYFDDEEPGDGSILLRGLSPHDASDFTKKCSKKMPPEYKHGQRFEIPDEMNDKKYSDMIWDFVIVDWKNIVDENGKKIECTTENKLKLINHSNEFVKFVSKSLDILNSNLPVRREEIEKNSPST